MSFESLASEVFRLGCGIGMHSALEGDEYRRIRQTLQGLGTPNEADSALVELLGGRLADRAFHNIPWSIRSRIHEWNDGAPAQLQLLQDICRQLNSSEWRRTGGRNYAYNSDNRCVLPQMAGSWEHGPVQPNCLGVAQMTVGFARAVGAPHYLLNVVHANQDTLLRYKIRTLHLMHTVLTAHPDLAELSQSVECARWKALEFADRPAQAHHVLVVQLANEVWWVVDPYLGALYPLDDCPEWSQGAEWVANNHHRVAAVRPRTSLPVYLRWINMYLRALEFCCAVYVGRFSSTPELFDPVPVLLSYIAAYIGTCESPVEDLDAFGQKLAYLEIAVEDAGQDTSELENEAMGALVYATHDIENLADLNDTIQKDPEAMMERFGASMLQMSDIRHEAHLARRVIRYFLKDFTRFLEGLDDNLITRQHECMEIAWAPMGLGIATLNHVQSTLLSSPGGGRQSAGLQGKLAALFSGQWVLYDALALSREKGEPIHPDYLPALLQHLERVRQMSEMMIDPLRLLSA